MKYVINLCAYLACALVLLGVGLFFLCGLLIPFTIGVSIIFMPIPFFMFGLAMLMGRTLTGNSRLGSKGKMAIQIAQCGLGGLFARIPFPRLVILGYLILLSLGSGGFLMLLRKH